MRSQCRPQNDAIPAMHVVLITSLRHLHITLVGFDWIPVLVGLRDREAVYGRQFGLRLEMKLLSMRGFTSLHAVPLLSCVNLFAYSLQPVFAAVVGSNVAK